jgi:hypothetical protein
MADTFYKPNATTGNPVNTTPITTSAGAGDANKIPALDSTGRFDVSLMPVGVTAETVSFVASETIGAGKFVNLHLAAGVLKGRLADNSNGRRADCFVLSSVSSAATGVGYKESNTNTALSGLTIASDYFLGTAGDVTATVPTAGAGVIAQRVGKAQSATAMTFDGCPVYELG